MRQLAAGLLFVLVEAACAAGGAQGQVMPAGPGSSLPAASFTAWEEARLAELATVDPRLSSRMRIEPTEADSRKAVLGAILAEDRGLRVVDKRADLFSFDGRARELDVIAARVASPPRDVPATDPSSSERKEIELLARMVAEERARVEEERELPRSASALVRGVVATWTPPGSLSEVKDRDVWLAARLSDVSASVQASPLRAVEVTELEDALDPLERLANPAGFPRSQAALARLRVMLAAAHAGKGSGMGWSALHEKLSVHLGVAEPEAALRAEVAKTEARLRDEARGELARLPEASAKEAVRSAASTLLDATAAPSVIASAAASPCAGEGSASRVRLFSPPPERAVVCAALRAISGARTDVEAVAALLATHDAVVIAAWALAIHLDHADPDDAPPGLFLLAGAAPEEKSRLMRFAAARPVACVGAARMAALLGDGGAIERQARARRWLAFGDAPLDIVAREMAW